MKRIIFYSILCIGLFLSCKNTETGTTVCQLYQQNNPRTYSADCGCKSDRFQIDELCAYKINTGVYLTSKFTTNINSGQGVNRILFYLSNLNNLVPCNNGNFGSGPLSPLLTYLDSKKTYQSELNSLIELGDYGYQIELDLAKGTDLNKLNDVKGRIIWRKNDLTYEINDPIIEDVTFKIYK